MRRPLIALALTVAACPCADANSLDLWGQTFLFSGFGTLGVVHSSEDLGDYAGNYFSPSGAGFTDEWSMAVDSKLGAQVTTQFTPKLSAMVQIVAEQRYDNTYKPQIEWANLKYQITPDLSIRAGRELSPTFLVADSRKVGYANPWVRPPLEAYYLAPFGNIEGVDLSYRVRAGKWSHTFLGIYGQTSGSLSVGGEVKARKQWVLSDVIEAGPVTVRVTYQRAELVVDYLVDFLDRFRAFGPQGVALADKYSADHTLGRYFSVGAMYDPGKWFVAAEGAIAEYHSILGRCSGWYASGGYRFGKLTPYLTYGELQAGRNAPDPGLDLSLVPPEQVATASALNAGLSQAQTLLRNVQSTVSVGTRWDFMQNVALKLQYDHIDLGADSAGTLINVQPGFERGGTVHLFSLTLDFVL